MNFFTKIHELFRQKEKIVKKPQKHDANLQKNSTLYFQVGLIICLLTTNALFEMYFETKVSDPITYDLGLDDVTYVTAPVIEKKPMAMVKPEPKVEIKTRRFIDPPIVVPDDTNLPKDPEPVVPKPSVAVTPVKPSPPKLPIKKGPFGINDVTQVPIFPGCEGLASNKERIKCMSSKLHKIVQRKFDGDLAADLGLSGRQKINVRFTVDKSGNVTDILTNSKHKALSNEAKRVMTKVPPMKAAKQSNKEVAIIFDLPIIFQVQ